MIGRSTVASLGALFGYLILFEGVIAGFRPRSKAYLLVRAAIVIVSQPADPDYARFRAGLERRRLLAVPRAVVRGSGRTSLVMRRSGPSRLPSARRDLSALAERGGYTAGPFRNRSHAAVPARTRTRSDDPVRSHADAGRDDRDRAVAARDRVRDPRWLEGRRPHDGRCAGDDAVGALLGKIDRLEQAVRALNATDTRQQVQIEGERAAGRGAALRRVRGRRRPAVVLLRAARRPRHRGRADLDQRPAGDARLREARHGGTEHVQPVPRGRERRSGRRCSTTTSERRRRDDLATGRCRDGGAASMWRPASRERKDRADGGQR